MRYELVVEVMKMAFFARACQTRGKIFYEDRGSQFRAKSVVKECGSMGLIRSMGATGCAYDHASAESFWSIFKYEFYYRHTFRHLRRITCGVDAFMHRDSATLATPIESSIFKDRLHDTTFLRVTVQPNSGQTHPHKPVSTKRGEPQSTCYTPMTTLGAILGL